MPFVAPSSLPPERVCRTLQIPASSEWLALVSGALSLLVDAGAYETIPSSLPPDDIASRALEMLEDYYTGSYCMVGSIVAVTFSTLPPELLPADGSTYARVNYPALYARYASYAPERLIDSDFFTVPDLREATLRYEPSAPLLQSSGADSIAIGIDELPTHTHTTQPHTHTTQPHTHNSPPHNHTADYPSVGIDIEGPGAPDFTAVGNPPMTVGYVTPTAVTIDSSVVPVDSSVVEVDSSGSGAQFSVKNNTVNVIYAVIAL